MGALTGACGFRLFGQKTTLQWKQLAAALYLATMWEFDDVRAQLIALMSRMIGAGSVDVLDRLEVSIRCRVVDWLLPAYQVLCERSEEVTTEEARRLGFERLVAIYRVRARLRAAMMQGVRCRRCEGSGPSGSQAGADHTLELLKNESVLMSLDGPPLSTKRLAARVTRSLRSPKTHWQGAKYTTAFFVLLLCCYAFLTVNTWGQILV